MLARKRKEKEDEKVKMSEYTMIGMRPREWESVFVTAGSLCT